MKTPPSPVPPVPLLTRIWAGGRFVAFIATVLAALLEFLWLRARGQVGTPLARALWLQRLSRRVLRVVGLRAHYFGSTGAPGVLLCNHLTYLDIIALSAHDPVVFVAKSEVRSWPIIGWAAACGGTVFVDRGQRSDVLRVGRLIDETVAQGVRVCLFPEGTSSDGTQVLPFRTSLLEPLVAHEWPITAAGLSYRLEHGSPELEVCYWGDMTFAPHFLRLLAHASVFGTVRYLPVDHPARCRKELGRQVHALVSELAHGEAQPAELAALTAVGVSESGR